MVKYIIAALAGASAAVIFALNARTPLSSEAEYSRHPQRREEKFQDDVSVLIRGLRSPDPQARSIFHRNLVEETGMFFGFKPAALPEERMAAIGRWEDWWAANYNKTKEQWLIDCLSLEDYDGKVLAVKTLARMSSGASTPAIVSLLDDPDAQLRIEAVRALGRLKPRMQSAGLRHFSNRTKSRACAAPQQGPWAKSAQARHCSHSWRLQVRRTCLQE